MRPIPPGIKIGTSARTADRREHALPQAARGDLGEPRRYAGNRHRRRLHQDARAMGSGRLQGLQHRQRRGAERQPSQHAGGHAESSGTRPEDRRVPELHPLPGQGRHSLLALTPTWATASGAAAARSCLAGTPAPRWISPAPTRKETGPARPTTEPLSHGRVFTKEEIWENYTYFIKKVVPVAEEAGVRIGIHPDDPPQPMLAGVPRCIFSNFEGYKTRHRDRQQPQHRRLPVLRIAGWKAAR